LKTRTLTHDRIPETYAGLAALCMPRPLHDETDYEGALEVLNAMAGFELNADQTDYFDAIATFVEKYETAHHAVDAPDLKPVEVLRALLEEHGMTESDLGRLLGDRSLGHRVLTGERELSKSHIRTLAGHFAIAPRALLGA